MKLLIVEFVLFLKLCSAVPPRLGERCNIIEDGKEAYCKLFSDCPTANALNTKNDPGCSPHNSDLVVCCRGAITNPNIVTVAKSIAKCQEYSTNKICNMEPLSSLIENNILMVKNFPHVAKLLYRNVATKKLFSFSDEGTLVSARYVVTVASSLNRYPGYTGATKIRFGAIDLMQKNNNTLTTTPDGTRYYYNVLKTIAHPNYQQSIHNNIALIKLSKNVKFSQYIRPICLPDTNVRPDAVYRVYYNFNSPNVTQRPLVKYQRRFEPNDVCHIEYRGYEGYLKQDDSFICSTSIESNDSKYPYIVDGAPILVSHPSVACSNILLGVSLTTLRGRIPAYSINIYHYREWIESIIWAKGEE